MSGIARRVIERVWRWGWDYIRSYDSGPIFRNEIMGFFARTLKKRWLLPFWVLFFLISPRSFSDPNNQRFKEALDALSKTPSGQALIKKALRRWKVKDISELVKDFKWGTTSRTDTTLTRQFNPVTGREEKFRHLTIYLKDDQPLLDLALDMAHELVHASARPAYDPYDPSLTPGKYISLSLEAEGGEIDAVLAECEIGLQWVEQIEAKFDRCKFYLESGPDHQLRLTKDRVKKGFYRVGQYKKELVNRLGPEASLFPDLSSEKPLLFSSTGHAPYPIALLREYEEITQTACNNSRRRMESIVSSSATSASEVSQEDVEHFMMKRCH